MENNSSENQIRKTNYYAAGGTALLSSLITIGFVVVASLLAVFITKTNQYSDWTSVMAPVMACFYILSIVAVATIIPILHTERHGWRTVLATLLIEFVVLFLLALATLWIGNLFTSNDDCSYATSRSEDFSTSISAGASIQQHCYTY